MRPRTVVSALSFEKWFLRRKYHFVPPFRGICSFTRKMIFETNFVHPNVILCPRSVVSWLSLEKWFFRRKYHFVHPYRGICSFTRKMIWRRKYNFVRPYRGIWTFTRKMIFERQISFCAPVPWYLDFHSKNDFWDANIILCTRTVVSGLLPREAYIHCV